MKGHTRSLAVRVEARPRGAPSQPKTPPLPGTLTLTSDSPKRDMTHCARRVRQKQTRVFTLALARWGGKPRRWPQEGHGTCKHRHRWRKGMKLSLGSSRTPHRGDSDHRRRKRDSKSRSGSGRHRIHQPHQDHPPLHTSPST